MSIAGSSELSVIPKKNDKVALLGDERTKPRKVLEEEEYLDRMAHIIRRDFFSDVEFPASSPSNRSTINRMTDSRLSNTPGTNRTQLSTTSSVRSRREACTLGLNEYLDKYTSEDNAYFDKLQRKDIKKHQAKHPWLYANRIEHNKTVNSQLKLPSATEQASLADKDTIIKTIDWPHNPKNALFYPIEHSKSNYKSTVNYNSSRYINDSIFKVPNKPAEADPKPRVFGRLSEKVGVDGKLIDGSATPKIGGYSFVEAPEPTELDAPVEPVVKQSPSSSNRFYLPNASPRDELAHKLYEDRVAKNIRTPRTGGSTKAASARGTPSSFRRNYADFSFSPERFKLGSTPRSKR